MSEQTLRLNSVHMTKDFDITIRPPHMAVSDTRDAVESVSDALWWRWCQLCNETGRPVHPHEMKISVQDVGITRVRVHGHITAPAS